MEHGHELLPVPPRRVPAISTQEQQAQALTLLIQHSGGPGHVALRAALSDALAIATGKACSTHYIRLPKRGDTKMSCLRCSWSRALTAEDVEHELATLDRHLSRARKVSA